MCGFIFRARHSTINTKENLNMSIRKLSSILLTTLILFGATSAFATDYKTTLTLTVAASSPTYDEVYTFTQPADLTITQSGWNSLGNITASYGGSNAGFDSSKKLVVTVSSTNGFALKSGENSITYTHVTSENDTSATTTFEFTAAEINATDGTSKAVGVIVDDYSSAAAGTYTDEITYSVEVQSAASSLLSLTISSQTFYYVEGETWSQAISNHSTENANWSIANGGYICYNNDMNQTIYNTTIGTYIRNVSSITANTVIDATQGWTLQ